MGHAGSLQGVLELGQLLGAFGCENDGVRARWEASWAALAGGMGHLRSEDPEGQIPTDDDVMGQGVVWGREGLTVKVESCLSG